MIGVIGEMKRGRQTEGDYRRESNTGEAGHILKSSDGKYRRRDEIIYRQRG